MKTFIRADGRRILANHWNLTQLIIHARGTALGQRQSAVARLLTRALEKLVQGMDPVDARILPIAY